MAGEVLEVNRARIECEVLEVSYDREQWNADEQTVRYWIDPKSLLVLKEAFAERQERGDKSALWHWVYTVDGIKLNEEPRQTFGPA